MFKLTGKCCGSSEAISFLENLGETFPDAFQDGEFLNKYESVLNRVRYELTKNTGIKPKSLKAKYSYLGTFYSCGNCGASISVTHDFCSKCGRLILWDTPRCLTK